MSVPYGHASLFQKRFLDSRKKAAMYKIEVKASAGSVSIKILIVTWSCLCELVEAFDALAAVRNNLTLVSPPCVGLK